MAFNIKVSQIRDFATEVGNTASVAANTAKTGITTQQANDITANNAKVGVTVEEQNTINSKVVGEPTGSSTVLNVVQISQADYDAAVTAVTTVATTLYVING